MCNFAFFPIFPNQLFNGLFVYSDIVLIPDFYYEIRDYEEIFGLNGDISKAMDYGTENDVRAAIAEYISGEYNPLIIAYVYTVNWLEPSPGGIAPTIDIMA